MRPLFHLNSSGPVSESSWLAGLKGLVLGSSFVRRPGLRCARPWSRRRKRRLAERLLRHWASLGLRSTNSYWRQKGHSCELYGPRFGACKERWRRRRLGRSHCGSEAGTQSISTNHENDGSWTQYTSSTRPWTRVTSIASHSACAVWAWASSQGGVRFGNHAAAR